MPTGRLRRVAFIYEGVAYGGTEEYILLLLRNLDRRRYDPIVVIPGSSGSACPEEFLGRLRAQRERVITTPSRRSPRALGFWDDLISLRRVFTREQVHIVHIHTSRPDAGRCATLAARLGKVRAVIRSEHLPPSCNLRPALRHSIRPFDWLTRFIIAGSEACHAEQIRLLRRDPAKVLHFVYGIDLQRFSVRCDPAEAKRRLGLDPDTPVVGTVGRLSPEKLHTCFIDAAARVAREFGRVNFVLVGDGPLEEELRQRARGQGLNGNFHFVGFQPDTVPYIQAMDVTVMSSSSEGISLAMLEFMAMAKPVVSTSEPSFCQTLVHGESGLLVPLEDSRALAGGILQVLRHPELGERLGNGAHARVWAEFDIQRNVSRLMDVYDLSVQSLHSSPVLDLQEQA